MQQLKCGSLHICRKVFLSPCKHRRGDKHLRSYDWEVSRLSSQQPLTDFNDAIEAMNSGNREKQTMHEVDCFDRNVENWSSTAGI